MNSNAVYSQKYLKEADVFFNQAKEISSQEHWNLSDKQEIKIQLTKKLKQELTEKTFLDDRKYDYVEKKVEWILKDIFE